MNKRANKIFTSLIFFLFFIVIFLLSIFVYLKNDSDQDNISYIIVENSVKYYDSVKVIKMSIQRSAGKGNTSGFLVAVNDNFRRTITKRITHQLKELETGQVVISLANSSLSTPEKVTISPIITEHGKVRIGKNISIYYLKQQDFVSINQRPDLNDMNIYSDFDYSNSSLPNNTDRSSDDSGGGGTGSTSACPEGPSCYTGPSGTLGVGVCKSGNLSCMGECLNEVLPSNEICSDALDNDCDHFIDGLDPDCASPGIQQLIESRLAGSEQKNLMKQSLSQWRSSLQLWGDGQDYAPTLESMMANGAQIVIPPGRYKIKSRIDVSKNNLTIKAANLGEVILEADNISDRMFSVPAIENFTLQNIILWGDAEPNTQAIRFRANEFHMVSNVVYNFETGLLLESVGSFNGKRSNISENYFFNNGYIAFRLDGDRSETGSCTSMPEQIVIENNFISDNYQGIHLYCSKSIRVINNIIRDSQVNGLRHETTSNSIIEGNLFHNNANNGLNVYAYSYGSTFSNNIIINNGKADREYWSDCWKPQRTIADYYTYLDALIPIRYATYFQENGQFVFKNYWCQSNGVEVELRNSITNCTFQNNIIGRYGSLPWESDLDLQISFYPIFYGYDRTLTTQSRISRNNRFMGNYFLNSNMARIKELGCSDVFQNNKKVSFSPYLEQPFDITYGEMQICSKSCPSIECQFAGTCNFPECVVCDFDGICEHEEGEMTSGGCADCTCVSAGQKGEKQHGDRYCCGGLNVTERIFPALPDCTNHYTGTFYCTHCGNGACDLGEDWCSCPSDCVQGTCGNPISEEICDGLDNNCDGENDEGCDDHR